MDGDFHSEIDIKCEPIDCEVTLKEDPDPPLLNFELVSIPCSTELEIPIKEEEEICDPINTENLTPEQTLDSQPKGLYTIFPNESKLLECTLKNIEIILRNSINGVEYTCRQCKASFANLAGICKHLTFCKLKHYECFCGDKNTTLIHLRSHIESEEELKKLYEPLVLQEFISVRYLPGDEWYCNFCTGTDKHSLLDHTTFCQTCGIFFPTLENFENHQKLHSDQKIIQYRCRRCDARYNSKILIESHESNCTGHHVFGIQYETHFPKEVKTDCDEPLKFSCLLCSKSFKGPCHLKFHLKLHNINGCEKCKHFYVGYRGFRNFNNTFFYVGQNICPLCTSHWEMKILKIQQPTMSKIENAFQEDLEKHLNFLTNEKKSIEKKNETGKRESTDEMSRIPKRKPETFKELGIDKTCSEIETEKKDEAKILIRPKRKQTLNNLRIEETYSTEFFSYNPSSSQIYEPISIEISSESEDSDDPFLSNNVPSSSQEMQKNYLAVIRKDEGNRPPRFNKNPFFINKQKIQKTYAKKTKEKNLPCLLKKVGGKLSSGKIQKCDEDGNDKELMVDAGSTKCRTLARQAIKEKIPSTAIMVSVEKMKVAEGYSQTNYVSPVESWLFLAKNTKEEKQRKDENLRVKRIEATIVTYSNKKIKKD